MIRSRKHRRAVLLVSFLLTIVLTPVAHAETVNESRELAEYLLTGYPLHEGSAPLWYIARETVLRRDSRGLLARDWGYPFTGFNLRPIDGTGILYSNYFVGLHDIALGRFRGSVEVFADLFNYLEVAFGLSDFDTNPEYTGSSYFRSISDQTYAGIAGVDELHVKTNDIGGRVDLAFGDGMQIRADIAVATFDHVAVEYESNYDPTDLLTARSRASTGAATSTQRQRYRGEVRLFPAALLRNAPRIVPDELGLEIVVRDDLTPEGYAFSGRYDDTGLGTVFGTVGYGETRDVVFLSTLASVHPIATTVIWQAERGRGSSLFTRRFMAGLDVLALTRMIAGEPPLTSVNSDFFVSTAIGPEYIATPSDIVDNFLFAEPARNWSLTASVNAALGGFLVTYIDMRISEVFRLFSDGPADAQLRAGIMMRGL
ncbi:MAG: hypothetical protein EA383_01370 [Spirochaetaceae bacterium]|nr:MAG: hypothetical protein EA383_01370 [Spirochaetaceae bacterium]